MGRLWAMLEVCCADRLLLLGGTAEPGAYNAAGEAVTFVVMDWVCDAWPVEEPIDEFLWCPELVDNW